MTQPSVTREPPKSVLSLAAPLVVSFWMRAVITFVDTVYASFLGDAEVAAIGLSIPFEFLMIALWVGLSTGLTSGLSRAMGARQWDRIEQYVRVTWRMVGLLAPLFTIVGAGIWLFSHRVGLEPETARAFQVYGSVLVAGSAVTTFWSVIPDSLVKAHQDTRSTMWAGIWTNLINLVLNTVFLFGFEWGVFGIALSTAIGRLGGLLYALSRAERHESRRRSSGEAYNAGTDPAPYRTILSLAVPSSLTFSLMALETFLINGLLASMRNATEAIAAYSIYYRLVMFWMQPIIAIAVAMLPFAASRYGAGDESGIRAGLRQAIVVTVAYSIVAVGPISWFTADWLANRLAESPVTAEYASFALRTVPLACLSGILFLLCRPVFEAMNRGRPGLLMALLRYAILTAPLAWAGMILAERAGRPGLHGLIFGSLLAGAISSVVFLWWTTLALPSALPARSAEAPRNP